MLVPLTEKRVRAGVYHPPQGSCACAAKKGRLGRGWVAVPQTDTGRLAEQAKVDE